MKRDSAARMDEQKARPRYEHKGKGATFLGQFQDFDLYYQEGRLIARFSDEPHDFMAAVRKSQYDDVPALVEARLLAEERGLEMNKRKEPVAIKLTTSKLMARVSKVGGVVECFRFERTYRRDHLIRVLRDGSVEEFGTQQGQWSTTVEVFLRKYPDRLGRIWHLEPVADPDAGDD